MEPRTGLEAEVLPTWTRMMKIRDTRKSKEVSREKNWRVRVADLIVCRVAGFEEEGKAIIGIHAMLNDSNAQAVRYHHERLIWRERSLLISNKSIPYFIYMEFSTINFTMR